MVNPEIAAGFTTADAFARSAIDFENSKFKPFVYEIDRSRRVDGYRTLFSAA